MLISYIILAESLFAASYNLIHTQSQWSPRSGVVIARLDSGGMEF